MKLNVYSIYDVKAEAYMTPFFMNNDAVAMRGFKDAVHNVDSNFGKHPQDFTLFRIGNFSDVKGDLVSEVPTALANGIELVNSNQPVQGDLDGINQSIQSSTPS